MKQSTAEAILWHRRAAEQRFAPAENRLALMADGTGMPKDEVAAFAAMKVVAERGMPEAQVNLGWMLAQGRGTKASDTEALASGSSARPSRAMRGARWRWGCSMQKGAGRGRIAAEALRWFNRAADQNHPEALRLLGVMHETGNGVAASDVHALPFYRRPRRAGTWRRSTSWAFSWRPAGRGG